MCENAPTRRCGAHPRAAKKHLYFVVETFNAVGLELAGGPRYHGRAIVTNFFFDCYHYVSLPYMHGIGLVHPSNHFYRYTFLPKHELLARCRRRHQGCEAVPSLQNLTKWAISSAEASYAFRVVQPGKLSC